MMVRGQVVGAANVEAGGLLEPGLARGGVEDVEAEAQTVGHAALYAGIEEEPVLVAVTVVVPVTATAIDGIEPQLFAQPQRKEEVGVAGAEILVHVAGREIEQRIEHDARTPAIVIRFDEAIADADLSIARPEIRLAAADAVEGVRLVEMEIEVGRDRIAEIKAWRRAGGLAFAVRILAGNGDREWLRHRGRLHVPLLDGLFLGGSVGCLRPSAERREQERQC